jgi:hypothetical protein
MEHLDQQQVVGLLEVEVVVLIRMMVQLMELVVSEVVGPAQLMEQQILEVEVELKTVLDLWVLVVLV